MSGLEPQSHISKEVSASRECSASVLQRGVVVPIRKPKSIHEVLSSKAEKEPDLQQKVELRKRGSSLAKVFLHNQPASSLF